MCRIYSLRLTVHQLQLYARCSFGESQLTLKSLQSEDISIELEQRAFFCLTTDVPHEKVGDVVDQFATGKNGLAVSEAVPALRECSI